MIANSFRNLSRFRNQKLRRHDHGNKKSCGRVEEANARLAPHVCKMTEVPRHQVIDLVKRSKRYMESVGDIFAMKDAARDVTVREDRSLVSQLNLLERRNQASDKNSMRLWNSFQFASHQR